MLQRFNFPQCHFNRRCKRPVPVSKRGVVPQLHTQSIHLFILISQLVYFSTAQAQTAREAVFKRRRCVGERAGGARGPRPCGQSLASPYTPVDKPASPSLDKQSPFPCASFTANLREQLKQIYRAGQIMHFPSHATQIPSHIGKHFLQKDRKPNSHFLPPSHIVHHPIGWLAGRSSAPSH